MKKLRGILAVVLSLLLVAGVFGMAPLNAKAGGPSEINIYCWNEEWLTMVERYCPGYEKTGDLTGYFDGHTINWVMIPSDFGAYQNALDDALTSSSEKVDIFLIEADYAKKYLVPGIAKPLSEVGISKANLAYQYNYTKQIGSAGGVQYATTWQTCCGGMIYNREIAKHVLGTDDPAKVQAMVSDWDKFESVAKKMKAAGYKMMPSAYTDYRLFCNNMTSPWVSDGKVNIDSKLMKWVYMSKSMVDAEQTSTYGIWDTNEDFQRNISFCVFGPAWYFKYCMQEGSGYSIADRGGWALCEGPEAHYWGGTWICVADETDEPETCGKLLKYMTTDQDILESILTYYGDDVNHKTVIEKAARDSYYGNSILGGQNPYSIFKDSLNHIDAGNLTVYDQICNEKFQTAMQGYFIGKDSLNEAIDHFYNGDSYSDGILDIYPELKRGTIYYGGKPTAKAVRAGDGVEVSWSGIGADKYAVFRKSGSESYKKIKTVTGTSYVDTTAVLGETYSYQVRGVSSSGGYIGEKSNAASITYKGASIAVAGTSTENGIKLTWDAQENAKQYFIYKKNTSGEWAKLKATTGLKYTDTAVKAGEKYTYSVVPVNANGNEMTKYGSGRAVTFTIKPIEPTVKARAAGVGVSWEKVKDATKYRIFRKTGSSDWTKVTDTKSLSYTDKSAIYGKTYQYAVRAMNSKGNFITNLGKGASIQYLVAAPKITLNNLEEGIEISWGSMTNAAQYSIYVKKDSGRWAKLATVIPNTSYVDTTAVDGQSYTYAVVGLDAKGHTMNDYGSGSTIVRNSKFVSGINGYNSTEGVILTWNEFAGADKYRVYRKNASGSWSKLGVTESTHFTDANAAVNEKNTYAVLAVGQDGTVLTGYGKGKTIKFVIPSVDPVAIVKSSGVRLEWFTVVKAEKYQVCRKTKSTDWAVVGTTSGLSYTDKSVESGKTYYYAIVALDAKGKALNSCGDGTRIKFTATSVSAADQKNGMNDEEILGEGIVEEILEEDAIEESSEEETSEEIENAEEETSEEDIEDAEEETSEEDIEDAEEETSEDDIEDAEEETSEEDIEDAEEEDTEAVEETTEEVSEETSEIIEDADVVSEAEEAEVADAPAEEAAPENAEAVTE